MTTTDSLQKKDVILADETPSFASVAALIELACDNATPAPIRDQACDALGIKITERPKLAAFAAQQLFAKRDAGASAENICAALIQVIRTNRSISAMRGEENSAGADLRDAIDAVSEAGTDRCLEAENRIIVMLKMQKLYSTRVA